MACFSIRMISQSVIAVAVEMRRVLPGQASFTAKVVLSKNCDHSFLALLGNDGDLDLALLDVKNKIGSVPLPEDRLIFAICGNGSAAVNCGQELFRIKR